MSLPRRGLGRAGQMAALILAGETIFLLPFVVARVFRPTLLDVFGFTNLQLGTAFSVYGVVAMAAYFVGGPLADRYPARQLMSAALLATALGGLVIAGIPSLGVVIAIYGWWGMTTILLFWAAMIRATREWGGADAQGRAYGLLDGGRGLVAAVLASTAVVVFAGLLPAEVAEATLAERREAFGQVLWLVAAVTAGVAVVVWFAIPEGDAPSGSGPRLTLAGVRAVIGLPTVWLQAIIIVCAYVGYKGTDDFALYARDAFGFDEVAAAGIGALSFWVRPVAAIGAGFVGDRIGLARATRWSFGVMTLGASVIAACAVPPGLPVALIGVVIATGAGIYALRGLYFALFGEGKVPLAWTGSAVGVVSCVGFTPDVFMGPVTGVLLDRSPGAVGHQHVFALVAAFGVIGWLAARRFGR